VKLTQKELVEMGSDVNVAIAEIVAIQAPHKRRASTSSAWYSSTVLPR
jgi:hypothetical protein